MQTILDVVVPIFSLIALGYGAARTALLSAAVGDALTRFVFVVAVPALLFRTLARAEFDGANPLALWASYFAGVAVTWALASALVRLIGRPDRRSGVIAGISASFANTVFIAIPAVERAYGEPGLEALFLVISVHLPTMMIAATLLMERAASRDARDAGGPMPAASAAGTVKRVIGNLLRNAIVIGILAGAAFRLTGMTLPGAVEEVARLLGATAGPLALIALGMSLTRFGLSGEIFAAGLVSVLSLLVMPAIVYAVGIAFLPPIWLKTAVLTAACPAGVNAYLLAAHFGAGEKLTATTILVSTVLSVATLSLWLAVLG